VTTGLSEVADGVDEESSEEDEVSEEDESSVEDDVPDEDVFDDDEAPVVVVVWLDVLAEVELHASPVSASAAAAVSATAQRRSAFMRRRPRSRAREGWGSGEFMAARFRLQPQAGPRGSWGMAETGVRGSFATVPDPVKIGVPKETLPDERRVALVPDVIRKLAGADHEVVIEAGAGEAAGLPDGLFTDAGATLGEPWSADVVAKVGVPTEPDIAHLRSESVLVGFLAPLTNGDGIQAIAATGATAFAMEAIPRISRAQSMDALSSQATVSGYRAALIGAQELGRFYPMLMTAAGTIPPAQVLILGAGVAGLQAIATARRLGAVVTAFDVRSAVKEQVQSLGARFLEVEGAADAEGAGGYARELTDEEQDAQRRALEDQIAKSDVVITTALVPGRPAPKLVTAAAVERMKPGAVIVDLAGEAGGNTEVTQPGETITTEGAVRIVSPLNLPSSMPEHASQLYARNVSSLLELMTGEDGALNLDFEDEIIKGACITRDGEIVHEGAKQAVGAS
jgi:H+-translocating NAD(P) transhydrogenase subunit alpha